MASTSIVWFRRDLRLSDNIALLSAAQVGDSVVPVYIHSVSEEGDWTTGAASRWWLHQSLAKLDIDLRKLGSSLIIRRGGAIETLLSLIEDTDARAVFFNRLYEPSLSGRDKQVEQALRARGVSVQSFNSSLLHEPHLVHTNQGSAFKVFTPFWNRLTSGAEPELPVVTPACICAPAIQPDSIPLTALELEPRLDWCSGMKATWEPGECGARSRLGSFLSSGISHYATARDHPDQDGASMLSPHLHFGEISPRQIWHALRQMHTNSEEQHDRAIYLKQLGWREFAYNTLSNFPHTADRPLRVEFERFPWCENKDALEAWQHGLTGYPIVDAGMRQLWQTGWMHNRVRMIAASFLTKDLLISWLDGARWFWDTLVDADLASNTLGWQWAAGCGADAAPYFRIFNPVLQGEKFDPNGNYVRRWLPELACLPARWIHKPWQAPAAELAAAGVELGRTYPVRIVDHASARHRALDALASLKQRSRNT